MVNDVQSKIHIDVETKGAKEAAGGLDKLADAQEGVVVASNKLSKAQTGADRAYKSLMSQVDANYRATQRLAQGQSTLKRALDQGIISAEQYQQDLRQLTVHFEKVTQGADRARTSFGRVNEATTSATAGISSLTGAYRTMAGVLAGVGAVHLGRQFVDLADQSKMLEGRLKLVTTGSAELADIQERLYTVAQGSGASLSGTVELYGRLARATKGVGTESKTLLTVTDTLQKAFAVSGASAQEAENAIIQLSQGLAAGALRGEEFNSVSEQGSRITELLADHLGMTIGELRKFAAEGGITTQVILDATVKGAEKIAQEYAKLPPTVEREMALMNNAIVKSVGKIDQELGFTDVIARNMKSVREAIESADVAGIVDKWVPSFNQATTAGTLLASVLAGRMAPSLIGVGASAVTAAANLAVYDIATRKISASATVAAASARGLGAALSVVGGPWGLAITTIAAGIGIWATRTNEASAALDKHGSVVNRVKQLYKEVGGDVEKFAEKVKEISLAEAQREWVLAVKSIKDAWRDLDSLRPMDGFWDDAPMLKFMEAFDKLRQNNDFDAFRSVMDEVVRLDPAMANMASRALDAARNVEELQGKGAVLYGTLGELRGESGALAGVLPHVASGVSTLGNAVAIATGQVQGMSAAMRDLILMAPEMGKALRAQEAVAAAQDKFKTTLAEANAEFNKTGNMEAWKAKVNQTRQALKETVDSVTGLTSVQEKLDRATGQLARDSLPKEQRARANLRAEYAATAKEIEGLIKTGRSRAEVDAMLAQNSANEARAMKNLNRDLAEQASKRGKAASAADKHAKAVTQLENAVDQLIHRNDEQIKLLELEAAGYGKSAEEVLYLKYAHDAETAAMRAKVPLTEQHLARLREQAQQVSALTAAIDAQRKAQEALNAVQDLVSATWVRALEDMILNAQTLQDAIKGIGDAWSKASLDALLTGKGPLAQFTGLASNDPNNPNAVGGIFGVLMGNQNKLLSQLPKQVQRGAEAGSLTGSYEGSKVGNIEGIAASGMTSWLQQNGKTILGVGAGLTSLVGAYGVGAQGGSMGMSAIGGGISGITGGLALASTLGLAAGPAAGIGALVGAGISVFANQQAKKQAKAERMAQAQAAYQDAIPQIQSFTRALRGEIVGSLQQTIDEVHQKANELGGKAFFAYQFDEVKRIENEFNAYVERTKAEFRDGYQGMLDQLSVGGGMGGAFASAKNEMASFGDELRGWTHDVATAFDWDLSVNHQAVMAAREAALAMLEPVESLSAVQNAIQQINGRASGLTDVLTKLGMSSEDAARAIDEGVGLAMDALRTSFSEDLTFKLNEVEGKDYLNEAKDAIAEMQQMYADAAALGVDEGERIWRYFGRTAQEIVNGAELTGDAFNELVTTFPEMAGVVHEFVAAMDTAMQSAADFNSQVQRQIFGAEGKGYISTAMDLVTERDALRKTAEQVGGDMALVETYYSKAAQSIVDSSQLTGDAFNELLLWVPELTGHVNAFAAAVQNVGQSADDFFEDMVDKVLGAQGKGYISDMRALITERGELMAKAQEVGRGADLVTQYFDTAAQGIVNSAQLTGAAFQDFLAWFPEFAGQLTEFSSAAQQAGSSFWEVQNTLVDKVLGAQGKSYIVDMRSLIKERDELAALADQYGNDLGLVTQYFDLAAQGIVDSAGLTGDAFNDLLAWFPDLAGSLRAAGQAVEQTTAQIEAAARRLQGYEDRWFNATNDNSSLDGALRAFDRQASAERATELAAGGQHLVALERALAAERLGVMADFASQAVSAAESAVATAQANLQSAAQAAIDAAQAQVDAAQTAAQAAAQAVSDAQSRVDAAQQALERAQDAVRQGYEEQASVLRDTVSRLQSFIKGIQQFKASLVLDDALSPFSPAQQLAEAQRQYQEIAAKALAGDTDAMDQLESVSRSYLSEARDYYASSEAYYQAFNDVQAVLDQVSASAQDQLSEAERQLAALDAQIEALTRIDDTVLSIEQAQAELLAAQQDLVTAQQQQAQADSALSVAQANLEAVQSQMDALLGINNSVMSVEQAVRELGVAQSALAQAQQAQADILAQQQALAAKNPNELYVQQLYRDIYAREADAGGLQYWTNQLDVGASTAAQVRERMEWERAHGAMRLGGIVGSYATGGMVGNGLYDVDSVLARYAGGGNIALAGGEFVTRAPSVNRDTLPTLAAINSTGRLPANDDSAKNEIRALRAEVASLKQALVAGFNATVAATEQNTGAVRTVERRIHQANGTR